MAHCFPFPSCWRSWSLPHQDRRRHDAKHAAKVENGGGGAPSPDVQRSGSNEKSAGRFKRLLSHKKKRLTLAVDEVDQQQPKSSFEMVDSPPPAEGTLKHWVGTCRPYEEVMQEIELVAASSSRVVEEPEEQQTVTEEKIKLATRIRKMFVKERIPEELEKKALRKEKKAIVKYLKGEGLYNRRMSYEQMKDLKATVEQSLENEMQKSQIQDIEMKEIKLSSPTPPPAAAASTPIDIPKPKSSSPTESAAPAAAVNIHHGSGRPISDPIPVPGTRQGELECPVCNPEIVVVQVDVHNEPPVGKELAAPEEQGVEATEQSNPELELASAANKPKSKDTQSPAAEEPTTESSASPRATRKRKEAEQFPPTLPEKMKKKSKIPRVVGFVLKPNVKLVDIDAIVGDKTGTPGAEAESKEKKSDPQNGSSDDAVPSCLQNLRWTFDKPFGNERLVE